MYEITSTQWSKDEEQAFTDALGKWVKAWLTECAKSGHDVLLGPSTESHLAVMWRSGRDYEMEHSRTYADTESARES